jgi:hypothetical protein
MQENMINKAIVYETLKKIMASDFSQIPLKGSLTEGEDSLVSLLIHDIFGAEILKTRKNKYWHFYNRIDGERLDFTGSEPKRSVGNIRFEDIPATPDETSDYVDQVDYSRFFMQFIRAFEETVGLDKYRAGLPA